MSLYPQHASLPLSELPSTEIEQPSPLLYGGPDDETLYARSPEEYLADLFGDMDVTLLGDVIRARGDVEIVAYRRRQVEPERFRWWASDAWELFVERFEEEFGVDDDCFRAGVDENAADLEARDLLAPILERLARRYLLVRQGEEVSRRTWTVDEVRAALGFASTSSAPSASPEPAAVPVHRFEPKGGVASADDSASGSDLREGRTTREDETVGAFLERLATMAGVAPANVHEHGWQWRPTDADTAFAPPFGTIRQCRVCGCLVAGGPTACARCAEAGPDWRASASAATSGRRSRTCR